MIKENDILSFVVYLKNQDKKICVHITIYFVFDDFKTVEIKIRNSDKIKFTDK